MSKSTQGKVSSQTTPSSAVVSRESFDFDQWATQVKHQMREALKRRGAIV